MTFERRRKFREKQRSVQEELEGIPRGLRGSVQNELRMVFWSKRIHDITQHLELQKGKCKVLSESIDLVRTWYSDFDPKIDSTMFSCDRHSRSKQQTKENKES